MTAKGPSKKYLEQEVAHLQEKLGIRDRQLEELRTAHTRHVAQIEVLLRALAIACGRSEALALKTELPSSLRDYRERGI